MHSYKKACLVLLTVGFFLTGCQTPALFYKTQSNVADVTQRAEKADQKFDTAGKPPSALLVNQGPYVDQSPINLKKEPSWLKSHIIIRGEQLPFFYYSRAIASGAEHRIITQYQTGLDENLKTSMNYSGDVKGALDLLAGKTGYAYTVHDKNIFWQAYITKTFDIAFLPGVTDYSVGKDSSGSSSSSGAAGGGPSQGTVSGATDDSAQSQYSNLKGKLSVWDDLEKTLKQLLSKDGKAIVSQATTTVTVHDKPSNVELVGKYIANLNTNLSKQVLVKIQVLEVTLSSEFNYGINWDVILNAFHGSQFVIKSKSGTPISLTSFANTPASLGFQQGVNGTSILVSALKDQGNVSVVSEPRVVCLNNQVSSVRVTTQNGYLASIQNTSTPGASGSSGSSTNSVTSQITPGNLITGLTLYILPKIMNDKVYLQVNADLSTNLGFQQISSTGGILSTTSAQNTNASVIQAPNVSQKQFNQRSVINTGDTLILSGFRRLSNQTGALQLLDSQALGSQAALQSNTETIVLITPIILNGL